MNFNPKQILEGWRNHLVPPSDLKDFIEKVSEERLTKCKNCPFNSTQGEIKNTSYCKACGCPLKAKSKCLSCTCGISNYNAAHPYDKKEVLWEAVTTEEERQAINTEIKEYDEKNKL